jgi:predicted kinase
MEIGEKMKKPKLVIFRGKPTSGKSTAYGSLRKNKLMKDWIFVDHVALKESMGKELGKKSLFAVLKVVMPTKKNIIIEEMSSDTVRRNISSVIKKYNYEIKVFQFTVRTKTAYKRDVQRVRAKKAIKMGKELIDEMHKMHDEKLDKNGIIVDTNKLGKRQVVDLIVKSLGLK